MSEIFVWIGRAAVLLTTMPIHEYAHGWAASRLGDDTARQQGRLTLNPFKHLDVLGSLLIIFAGFGWAKPVQVDPRNFKNPKRDMALTALAGPLSNILLALLFMVIYKVLYGLAGYAYLASGIILLLLEVMLKTNLGLAVFNLLPVPPLDGSKILFALLPDKAYFTLMRYERYVALALMALLFFTDILSGPLSLMASGIYSALDWLTAPIDWIFYGKAFI